MVPNQPIASGVMQPNVVQSPQVAPAQTTIVQPQQTSTLPTNESTETQAPNQEPFAVCILIICYFIYFGNMCTFIGVCFLVMDIVLVFFVK